MALYAGPKSTSNGGRGEAGEEREETIVAANAVERVENIGPVLRRPALKK